MPQPIRRDKWIGFDFTPEAILERPELAAHVAGISALWNEIDANITMTLLALLGAEAKTGMSIYLSITNDGAKRAAMDAICRLKLSADDQDTMRSLLTKVGKRYADRNKVIHGAWGVSPVYPKELLWGDIREQILMHVGLLALTRPEDGKGRYRIMVEHQNKYLEVWNLQDFENTEKRLRATLDDLAKFTRPILDRAFGR